MIMWTVGRGFTADSRTTTILERMRGWGEDDFVSIMEMHDRTCMINGDAYTEIVRNDDGVLVNMKPLNPGVMRTVVDKQGMIVRYEQLRGKLKPIEYKPSQILHSTENRKPGEIHGTSRVESVKWLLDTKAEILRDIRRVMHRSTIRVLYVDISKQSDLLRIRRQYEEGIKKGEVLVLPGKKGTDVEFEDLSVPPIQAYLEFCRYIDNKFSQVIGVPDVILGGSQQYTEASSKVGYLTFEQPYMYRQRKLEADLWNQVALKVTFNRPVSLKDDVQDSEAKNTGQVGFQQNETQVGVTRNE